MSRPSVGASFTGSTGPSSKLVPLRALLDELVRPKVRGDLSGVLVGGIAYDSRLVVPGDLFCCIPGLVTDGHRFAEEAARRGAVALVCEHPLEGPASEGAVQVEVAPGTARLAMAKLAGAFYGHPARDLVMAGVTGTNGKTTVSHLLGSILEAAGTPTEVLGTLGGARTTPESVDLQRILAKVRERSRPGERRAVAMEVSSHALVQGRVEGIHFDVAVFTNLTHDHLDFHGSMAAYFAAKARLFEPERALAGVVWAEDSWGRRLLSQMRVPAVAVRASDARAVALGAGRTTFLWRGRPVETALTGSLNVANALLAAEAALVLGVEPGAVVEGLRAAPVVPGRLEVLGGPGDREARVPFTVLVDYAHSPAGLEAALAEARRLAGPGGRVAVVFGCGGDRDRQKRPVMGQVAAAGADRVVVTSDNPRSEDPGAIIDEITAPLGAGGPAGELVVEPDRRKAIARALEGARAGDVVVVAGKGHETTQEVAGRRVPFDDRAVVRALLAARVGPGEVRCSR